MTLTRHCGSARLVLRPRLPQEPDRPLHIADGDGQGQRGRGGHEDPYENRRQRGHPQEVERDEKVRTNCHLSLNYCLADATHTGNCLSFQIREALSSPRPGESRALEGHLRRGHAEQDRLHYAQEPDRPLSRNELKLWTVGNQSNTW